MVQTVLGLCHQPTISLGVIPRIYINEDRRAWSDRGNALAYLGFRCWHTRQGVVLMFRLEISACFISTFVTWQNQGKGLLQWTPNLVNNVFKHRRSLHIIKGSGVHCADFPSVLQRRQYMTSCLLPCTPSHFGIWGVYSKRGKNSPIEKGFILQGNTFLQRVCFKREEFAPIGSKFFPFRVDPFPQEDKTILTELTLVEDGLQRYKSNFFIFMLWTSHFDRCSSHFAQYQTA